MRDVDTDKISPLGAPIKKPEAPQPQAVEIKPGISRKPDGTLETLLPVPPCSPP